MRAGLRKLDALVYRGERWAVVAALVVMAVVVFLDVIHRTFADPHSKLAQWIASATGLPYESVDPVAPFVLIAVFVWLAYFAMRTANLATPMSVSRALAFAVGLVLVGVGFVRLMVVAVPNGVVWSQPLALILVLWVGFLGASMCTHDRKHLRVEAVQRFIPERFRPGVGLASNLFTAAFCLFLMWVSWEYVAFNHAEWVETEGKGGLFKGIDVPKWLGFSVLPISFAIMTARFVGAGIAAARGELAETDVLAGMVSRSSEGGS